MLDFFRQKGLTSVVYGVIVLGMVLVFVLGFNPSAGKKLSSMNQSCAARVQGSCIEPKAHRAAFRLAFSRGTGGMRQAVASRIVLEGLIERELFAAEASRLGLTVGEDELSESIIHGNIHLSLPSENPTLGRQLGFDDGHVKVDLFNDKQTKQFDMKTYERVIKQMTGRSPAEFREWQERELLAAKMRDLVRAPIRVADDEAFDHFTAERTTSTVSFVMVRRAWIEKYAVNSDPKEFDAWAKDKANLKKIRPPVRHILVKVDKADDKPAKKKKAEDILARVKKGEDFAKLAKENSEDPGSKDKGGQYGGEMVEQFVDEFKKAYNDLVPGEIAPNLVETQFGFHIIKKDESSKDDMAKAFKESSSADVAKQMVQAIQKDVRGGKSGDDAVKAAIAQFGKYLPPKPKPAATGDAGAGEAGASATNAAKDGGAKEEDVEAADKAGDRPQWLTSSPFNKDGDPIPAISSDAAQAVTKFAFSAKASDVSEPIKTDDGFLLVQLKEQKPASRADYDKERDTYSQGMLAIKQAEALSHYARRLREAAKADIKVDEANLFGAPKGDGGAGSAQQPDEDDGEGP